MTAGLLVCDSPDFMLSPFQTRLKTLNQTSRPRTSRTSQIIVPRFNGYGYPQDESLSLCRRLAVSVSTIGDSMLHGQDTSAKSGNQRLDLQVSVEQGYLTTAIKHHLVQLNGWWKAGKQKASEVWLNEWMFRRHFNVKPRLNLVAFKSNRLTTWRTVMKEYFIDRSLVADGVR